MHSCGIYRYSGSWVSVLGSPQLFTPRSGHCGFALASEIFVFGGQNETEGAVYSTAFRLDVHNCEWAPLEEMPQPRHSGTCVVHGSRGLIFGGANQEGVVDSLLVFDPGKN